MKQIIENYIAGAWSPAERSRRIRFMVAYLKQRNSEVK